MLLTPIEFTEKIKEKHSSTIIDVRTPKEYLKGHLQNAINIDWNGDDFEKQISLLDTSNSVFVYCLSGGRSSSAADKMRTMGFSKVYELNGGILKWRDAGFPETTNTVNKSIGMSRQQFDALLISDKLVLVDFYAPWCAPCKKMKPYLDELEKEREDKFILLRIDADENQSLFKELKLATLPTLLLYKDKKLVWSHIGYIGKEEVSKQLK
ncbi:thioredoxin domain-containing protein [Cytophaga aurantiaca]|uniref:thioredoxin domain-containing protein n=1 Tax=Cytophaga aurantiaca TaxID=29530 RepID=UPI00036FE0A4|nr:thioredoxin domain-containing protein [Cytophaga aurantiaca]